MCEQPPLATKRKRVEPRRRHRIYTKNFEDRLTVDKWSELILIIQDADVKELAKIRQFNNEFILCVGEVFEQDRQGGSNWVYEWAQIQATLTYEEKRVEPIERCRKVLQAFFKRIGELLEEKDCKECDAILSRIHGHVPLLDLFKRFLAIDRANALLNMCSKGTTRAGMHWYSSLQGKVGEVVEGSPKPWLINYRENYGGYHSQDKYWLRLYNALQTKAGKDGQLEELLAPRWLPHLLDENAERPPEEEMFELPHPLHQSVEDMVLELLELTDEQGEPTTDHSEIAQWYFADCGKLPGFKEQWSKHHAMLKLGLFLPVDPEFKEERFPDRANPKERPNWFVCLGCGNAFNRNFKKHSHPQAPHQWNATWKGQDWINFISSINATNWVFQFGQRP